MGRRYFKKKKSGTNKQQESSLPAPWNYFERQELLKYLTRYRNGAIQRHERLSCELSTKKKQVKIGGVVFPDLTPELLDEPYLVLPRTLTSKQRKAVHEACIEVDLFHHSVGAYHADDRYVVVSIYGDAFDLLSDVDGDKDEQDESSVASVHMYKPWYLSGNQNGDHERLALKSIDALIDQPGDCLRDNQDEIDFDGLFDDLSAMNHPSPYRDETWCLVDSAEKMRACASELQSRKPTEMAFDLECYNRSKYAQLTCLLQIAVEGRDYVIDVLAPGVWEEVHDALAPFFQDSAIVKVGHSIGSLDIKCLHRDFGILVVNAFDTYEGAKELRLESLGLAAVCQYYGLGEIETYKELKELYQTCDWRTRPLTEPMMQYGRYDVHFLLRLRKLMMRDLIRAEVFDMSAKEQKEEAERVANSLKETLAHANDDEDAEEEDKGENDDFSGDQKKIDRSLVLSESRSLYESFETAATPSSFDEPQNYFTPDPTRTGNAADAAELRLQPRLMSVISIGQQRCKCLWKGRAEPPMNNSTLTNLLKRAKKAEVVFSESQVALYLELCDWRSKAAKDMGCLPAFVASLDLLALIAWKLPSCKNGLRRILYDLPEALSVNHQEAIVSLVLNAIRTKRIDTSSITPVYLYANRNKRRRLVQLATVATLATVAVGVGWLLLKKRRVR